MKKCCLLLLLLLLAVGGMPAVSGAETAVRKSVDERQLALITRLVGQLLSREHYRKFPLNDELSARIFDAYFDALDPNHVFFTQLDVNGFSAQRLQLDDQLRAGRSDFAFEVYTLYRRRVEEYRIFAEKAIGAGLRFDTDETYVPDRRKLPRPADENELHTLWTARLKSDVLSFRLLEKSLAENPEAQKRTKTVLPDAGQRVLRRLRDLHNELEQKEPIEILGIYLSAAAECYGPHSSYLSPDVSEDFDIAMKLSLFGIGATLTSDNGYIKVVDIVPGGPAAKEGTLQVDDRIIAVAQENAEPVDLIDMPVGKAVKLIRGEDGTRVTLTVLPQQGGLHAAPQNVTITRGKINLTESEAQMDLREISRDGRTDKVAVITIPSFYMDFDAAYRGDRHYKCVSRDVQKLLAQAREAEVCGIVLDMRGNGGGSLSEAIALSGLFIPSGPVVQVRGSRRTVDVENDEDPSVAYDGPLVILLSKFSASATEIFSGAMKDYRRAVIAGDSRSYGKGTVLSVIPLRKLFGFLTKDFDAGSLKFESAVFYRVSGDSVQQLGIEPDVCIPSWSEPLEVGEMFSPNHLPWDSIRPVPYTPVDAVPADVLAQVKDRASKRIAASAELQHIRKQGLRYAEFRRKNLISLNEEQRLKEYRAEKEIADELDRMEGGESASAKRTGKKKRRDAVLDEGVNVLLDLVELHQ